VTTEKTDDLRSSALDAYLARRKADGYSTETRTGLQAVIIRRHALFFVLRWVARSRAQRRLVVSVDEHGEVTSVEAEPVRW
jgi:hypothetical protein